MNQVLSTPRQREILFKRMYREVFPEVAAFVCRRGGNLEDARDLFQEGLVILYEKLAHPGFQMKKSAEAYLMSVVKYQWYHGYKDRERFRAMDIPENDFADEMENGNSNLSGVKILALLEHSGKKCLELLVQFYYDHVSMDEIARRFGFSGKRSATVQKYKCLEKVRNSVQEKSLQYEDFMA